MSPSTPTYEQVPKSEEYLCEDRDEVRPAQKRRSTLSPRLSVNIPGLCLLILVNAVFSVLVSLIWRQESMREKEEPWEHYSPVLKHVKLPFHTQYMNARLFPDADDPVAIFAQTPSREVDRAWNKVSKNMIVGLTHSDVLRLGKDPKMAVKFNPEWNITGDDGDELYLGVLDVFHQVHCLNMLRKSLIMNYDHYYGKAYGYQPEVFHETHLTHCTSILLQNIMCHADTTVYTHLWREGNPTPWADFGVQRQCRDFNSLVAFRDEQDVENSFDKFRFYTNIPKDAVVLPMEPGMSEMYASADEVRDGKYYKNLTVKGCR